MTEDTTTKVPEDDQALDNLRQKIADLKAQVQSTIQQTKTEKITEQNVDQNLDERKKRVIQDTKIMSLLSNAENTLKEFQIQLEKKLNTDSNDAKQFEELTVLVASLRKERDEALNRVKEFGELVSGTIGQTINGFLRKLENLEAKKLELKHIQEEQQKAAAAARLKLEEILKGALLKLTPAMVETVKVVKDIEGPRNFAEYLTGLKEHLKKLGWFHFKEKGALKSIIKEEAVFAEADRKKQDQTDVSKELQSAEAEISEAITQYKESILNLDI